MSTDLSAFRYEEGGVCVVTACLELVAFSDVSVRDGAAGFANFYQVFIDRFGDELRWYNTNDMSGMKPVDQNVLEMVPFWFSDETSMEADVLGMRMHCGVTEQDATAPAFEMVCVQEEDESPYSFFRIVLPCSWIAHGSDALLDLIHQTLDGFPLLSGYGGYGFFWRVLDPSIKKKAAQHYVPWMRRHPGFSHGDTFDLPYVALTGVVNVNWVTLLGSKHLEQLGGQSKLEEILADPIKIHGLKGNGVIIQAGSEPQIGDVNRQDDLPLYRRVAQSLKPVWIPDEEAAEAWISGFDPNTMEDWLGRYFK